MTCPNTYDTGDTVLVSWAVGCKDDDPKSGATTPLTFKKVGSTTTKNMNLTINSADVTNDSSGGYVEKKATTREMDLGFTSFTQPDAADVSSVIELLDLIDAETQAGRDPVMWLRYTDKMRGKHFYKFAFVTAASQAFATNDPRSIDFSVDLQATGNETNLPEQDEPIV